MQISKLHRSVLVLSSLIAAGIGAAILLAPASFFASYGIELAADPSLFSELRAPGAALLALGLLMGVGAFVPPFALASTAIAATVYLAYGLARVLSLALDGVPDGGLVGATVLELLLGLTCLVLALRTWRPVCEPTSVRARCGEVA